METSIAIALVCALAASGTVTAKDDAASKPGPKLNPIEIA